MSDHANIGEHETASLAEDAGVTLAEEGDKTASRAKGRPVLDFGGSHPEDAVLYEKMPVLGISNAFLMLTYEFLGTGPSVTCFHSHFL